METEVRELFERYGRFFDQSLSGEIDMDEVASVYASALSRHRLLAS